MSSSMSTACQSRRLASARASVVFPAAMKPTRYTLSAFTVIHRIVAGRRRADLATETPRHRGARLDGTAGVAGHRWDLAAPVESIRPGMRRALALSLCLCVSVAESRCAPGPAPIRLRSRDETLERFEEAR